MSVVSGVKTFLASQGIPERSTYRYEVDLLTAAGAALPAASVSSIKLTLRDVTSDTIVNSRSAVEVINQNGGVLEDGAFSFQFEEADTAIVGSASAERRVLTLDFRMVGGGRVTREVRFYVRNLQDIAA